MNAETLIKISKIIERDSTSSTYKFALLRGTIDIIQDNSPFVKIEKDKALIPTGLLIEKFLLYYYPLLGNREPIPQICGPANLSFSSLFNIVIDYYSSRGGLSVFYKQLQANGVDAEIKIPFQQLLTKMYSTICDKPMRFLGTSLANDYSIYKIDSKRKIIKGDSINIEYLINNYGYFSIPFEYYEGFKYLGSFISGQNSILFKWAEFSVNASHKKLSINTVLEHVIKTPITDREILLSKNLYKTVLKKAGNVFCVWSGAKIKSYDIDHVIPFSVWRNNDLWNLLPASIIMNKKKSHKIPSIELIEKSKERFFDYWELISKSHSDRFQNEIKISLLGNDDSINWKETAIKKLKDTADFLINVRGCQKWDYI